jgi:hypothetical protein
MERSGTGSLAEGGARFATCRACRIIARARRKSLLTSPSCLAPRPLFVHAPLRDSNFRWKSVDTCAKAARPIYKLLGNEKGLVIKHPDYNHNFPEDMREAAYQTIDSVLWSSKSR